MGDFFLKNRCYLMMKLDLDRVVLYKELGKSIPFKELTLNKKIGSGYFGEVWAGNWNQMDDPVAIKVCDSKTLPKSIAPTLNNIFKATHPNIIITYGICDDPGKFSIIMELMDTSVHDYYYNKECNMNYPKINNSFRNQIGNQVSAGLLHLHSINIAHPTLKSKSILLRFLPGGKIEVKLSSFGCEGLRIAIGDFASCRPDATVRWRSIESFHPHDKNNVKVMQMADIYSYGVLLWELYAMRLPFAEHQEDQVVKILRAGGHETIPDNFPKCVKELINKCWERNPEKRPTAREVKDEMGKITSEAMRRDRHALIPYVFADTHKNVVSLIQNILVRCI